MARTRSPDYVERRERLKEKDRQDSIAKRKPPKTKDPAVLARKRETMKKVQATRQRNLNMKRQVAIDFLVAGDTQSTAAEKAKLGCNRNAATAAFSAFLATPEGIDMLAETRKKFEDQHYLSVHKIRKLRSDIAQDKRVATKDRLRAMADECRLMGYDKQKESTDVQVHIKIGEAVKPEFQTSGE